MNGNLVYSYNMANGDWDRPDLSTYFKPYSGGGDFIAALCVKHPVTDDIYYSRSGGAGWYRFSAAANTWTKLSGETRNPWYAGSAIDSVRNRILIVGGYDNNAPEVRDLNGTRQSVSFGGLGASALSTGSYPGVIYDEANDKFLVFFNSGGAIAVRRVDPATWQVDAPSIGGSVPASRSIGILNAVQYAPELGGFVIANRYDGNVYFVRTSAPGQASPAPDTTPPAVPAGLIVS
jgi:hypothetical protein